jgi:hypothetical protein
MSDGEESVDHPGYVEIACIFLVETNAAVRVDIGTKKVWVPKSQVPPQLRNAFPDDEGDYFTLTVSEWFANKEHLI